ncbi:MAG: FimV/HubP family polar landmark protein [Cellvibrionaceae bacterium]
MRLRKLALAVGLASALSTELASALGLGEIRLLSTLNQPLEAEIKLLQAKELSENEILIGLAGSDDFQRAGIDRLYFLTDLKFSVVLDGPRGPVIKVSSRKPVREPYLNFLLETQWPNGRILREYTLLMDLPVFSDDSVRPVQSARTSTPRASTPTQTRATTPAARQEPQPREERAAAPKPRTQTQRQQSSRVSQGGSDVYGPVGSNDTLWEIALKVRPNRGYSVQQTMLAIQRLNPEAFINGNINLLRKGQVLRVPSAGDIDAVTERQAVNEVAQQNNQWSGSARRGEGAQLEGSKRRAPSRTQQQSVSGRLKVAGAESREDLQAGRAAGEVGGDVESLQNDLAISLEELDKSRRDNSELKDRVEELEDQIQTMERLLAVSSQELRAMQLGIESNNQAQTEATDGASDGDSASVTEPSTDAEAELTAQDSSSESSLESSSDAADTAKDSVADTAEAKAVAPNKVDPSKVVRSAKPKESSIMDVVMDNILYIGAALVALLAGIFMLTRRRKQDEEDAGFEQDETVFVEPTEEEEGVSQIFEEPETELEAPEEFELEGQEDELDLDEAVSTESQTGDAVGEADIYIAYGKFDQAEDMLLKALGENDQDFAARLKLMEVYVETQELEKFDQQYSSIQSSGNSDAISRAADLRQQFDDAPAYIAMSEADAEVEGDSLDQLGESSLEESTEDSFDFDLGDQDADTTVVAESSDDSLSLDEDFGLNFESSLTSEEPAAEAGDDEFTLDVDEDFSVSDLDDDLGLDLDLDLGGDDSDSQLEASDDLELSLDSELTAPESADSEEFSLDLDDTALNSDSTDFELELDTAADDSEGFELDLDLSGEDSNGVELDPALDAEAETATEEFEGFDLSLDDSAGSELESSIFEGGETADLEGLDLAAADLDADLASLDAELDADVPAVEADVTESESSEESFDLSLEDEAGDAFDVDMGDVDLDALDQEVDALSADLDVSDVFDTDASGEQVEETSLESELSIDSADAETDEVAGEPEGFDLSDSEFDLDIPTLGAETPEFDIESESGETAADVESESEVAGEPEVVAEEPEFDLAADLGLSAEDIEAGASSSEDEVFTEALSDLPMPEDVMAGDEMTDEDLDAELDFLADTDEAATKLDLARAYIDMGDQDGAKDILDEVVEEGNDEQKQQAQELLTRMS